MDVCVAVPVCSGLSNATIGTEESKNTRNCNMLWITKYVLNVIKPKIYIFENAPTFMGSRGDYIRDEIEAFALRLVIGTHPEVPGANDTAKKYISCGASPRAAQAIFKTAKARALLDGRYNVSFDDIEAVALPALRHRVTLSFEALAEGITTDQVIKKIMSSIPKD